jgi:hypothetical protein
VQWLALFTPKIFEPLEKCAKRHQSAWYGNYHELLNFIRDVDELLLDLVPHVDSLYNLAYRAVKENLAVIARSGLYVRKSDVIDKMWALFEFFLGDGEVSPLILENDDEFKWAYIAYASFPKVQRLRMLHEHLDTIAALWTVEVKCSTIEKLDDYYCQKARLLESGLAYLHDGKFVVSSKATITGVKIVLKARNKR